MMKKRYSFARPGGGGIRAARERGDEIEAVLHPGRPLPAAGIVLPPSA